MLISALLLALMYGAADVHGTPAPTPASTFVGTIGGPTIDPTTPSPTFVGTIGGPTLYPYAGRTSPCFDPEISASATIEETDEGGIRIKLDGCAISDYDLGDVAALFDGVGRDRITSVFLSDGTITTLPEGYFHGLDNLGFLSLSNNLISSLPAGIFDELPVLGSLYLSNNQLTTVSGLFDGLPGLGWLELSGNNLGTIEAGTFDKLTVLRYLGLTDASLVSLPLGLFDELSRLELLQLNNNNDLQCLPETGAIIYWYWSTSTTDCECTPAEKDACGDGFICNPQATLHECNGHTAPPSTTPGGTSPCFDPADSSVSVIMEDVGSGGIRIDFHKCDLSDDDLDDVAALIDEVGRASITQLWITQGTITALPEGYFQGLVNLSFLSVAGNALPTLPVGIFDEISQLKELFINDNVFTTLPVGLFDKLSELEALNLSGNELGTIEAGTFDTLTNLDFLYLYGMSLETLPFGLFAELKGLQLMTINGNPDLQCIPDTTAEILWFDDECECTQADDDACGDGFTCNPQATGHDCGPTPAPTDSAPTPTGSGSLGCFKDERSDRIMDYLALVDDSMTTELCELVCVGYSFFSTEYGRECWCGEADTDYARHGESYACGYECTGDPEETCGGYYAANVYAYPSVNTPAPTAVTPTTSARLGCFEDQKGDRIMELALSDENSMTQEVCEAECTGSTYFGLQYGRECWCGGEDTDYAKHGMSSACDYQCPGSPSETCGGFYAADVYVFTGVTPYLGCFEDQKADRIMLLALSDGDSMTHEVCEAECRGRYLEECEECSGSIYFGLQYGRECWCGDQDTDFLTHGEFTACDYECPGNPHAVCGGVNAMDVYKSFIYT
eukprot:g18846.t1